MPWSIVHGHSGCSEDQWAVVKDDTGEVVGCHDSEESARQQQRALFASESGGRSFTPPIEVRQSVLSAVDFKQRIIELIAVPYDQEAEIMYRGELWREVFTRSAFNGIEDHAGRVRVNREHMRGDTVGKVVTFDSTHAEGLRTRVRVAKTPRGEETLALADEDMLSPSVGFGVKKGSDQELDKRSRLRKIKRAFIDHIAMVESPAYEGAKVLAVREGPPAQPVEQRPLVTPGLDKYVNDDIVQWANVRTRG